MKGQPGHREQAQRGGARCASNPPPVGKGRKSKAEGIPAAPRPSWIVDCRWCRLSPVGCRPLSTVPRLSALRLSLRPVPTVLCLPSSVLRPPSSVHRPLSSALRPPLTAHRSPSSALRLTRHSTFDLGLSTLGLRLPPTLSHSRGTFSVPRTRTGPSHFAPPRASTATVLCSQTFDLGPSTLDLHLGPSTSGLRPWAAQAFSALRASASKPRIASPAPGVM